MSDVTLHGVLNMPPELWQEDWELDKLQRHARYVEASNKILELQAENERIIEELVAEEQDLAARRPDMDIEEFRLEAEAFDQKAIEIRAARDAKERSISEAAEAAQARFNEQVREVAGQVMIERGGKVILDSRSVYLALRSIDITDAVIARLDGLAAQQTEGPAPTGNESSSDLESFQETEETAPIEEPVSE